MIRTKIEIDGAKELDAAIRSLESASSRGRVTRAAVTAGGRIIRKAAKANARKRKRTGSLAKSVDMKVKTYPKNGNTVAVIGPRKDFVIMDPKWGKVNPNKYSHLVELGTEHSPAYPYLRPALMQNKASVAKAMQEAAGKALAREAVRAAKKGGR